MRFHLMFLFCLLGPWSLASAALEVSSSIPAEDFLMYEGVPLRLEITNLGREPVQFGGENPDGVITFQVKDTRNRVIPRTDKPLLSEPWIIPPGETSAREFDLVQLFRIRSAESYRCEPSVVLTEESAYLGKPVLFEVRRGTELGQVKRRRTDRVFTLRGINRNRRDELMLQVSNYDETMHLATYFLEKQLRLYPPHILMNSEGEVATLHYATPQQVVLCRFKADGKPVNRTFYKASPGVPVRLHTHPDQGFRVEGATLVPGQDVEEGAGEDAGNGDE